MANCAEQRAPAVAVYSRINSAEEVLLADGEEAGDVDTIDSDDHRAAVQPR